MVPVVPFWLLQRQVKVEPVRDDALRLSAPNLPVYEVAIRPEADAAWSAALYRLPNSGAESLLIAESAPGLESQEAAWAAAFELYRQHVIV